MKKLTLSELNQALKKYIQALPEKKQPLYEKVFEHTGLKMWERSFISENLGQDFLPLPLFQESGQNRILIIM